MFFAEPARDSAHCLIVLPPFELLQHTRFLAREQFAVAKPLISDWLAQRDAAAMLKAPATIYEQMPEDGLEPCRSGSRRVVGSMIEENAVGGFLHEFLGGLRVARQTHCQRVCLWGLAENEIPNCAQWATSVTHSQRRGSLSRTEIYEDTSPIRQKAPGAPG